MDRAVFNRPTRNVYYLSLPKVNRTKGDRTEKGVFKPVNFRVFPVFFKKRGFLKGVWGVNPG